MRIDTHLHLYADPAQGLHDLTAYPIVEYGEKDDVTFAGLAGTVADALATLEAEGFDYAAVLGSFELPELPHPPGGADYWPAVPPHADLRDDLVAYNRWLCDVGVQHPRLLPFLAANPAVMTSAEVYAHFAEMFGDHGARGLKLHPIAIRTYPDDPGLAGAYDALEEAGAPVVFHGGPDVRGFGWADPKRIAAVAGERPGLAVIMAHLGGAAWRDVAALAEAQPTLRFDLSEIVHWIGAPLAPTAAQVVALVRAVGVERVVLGSDFPWYTPGSTAAVVEELPGLSASEAAAIIGENAARLLSLG